MARSRWYLALVLLATLTADASAQFLVAPSGIGLRYQNRYLSVGGYFGPSSALGVVPFSGYYAGPVVVGSPFWPYGIVNRQVTVQVITPTVVVTPRYRGGLEEYDLSGVDLDVVPPSRIWGEQAAPRPPARNPAPAAAPKPPEVVPPPKNQEAPPKQAERPKEAPPAKQPEPEKVPPEKQAEDEIWQPRADAFAEAQRLVELGLRAFRDEKFGLASWRFEQACEKNPAPSRAYFLLGQAYCALGKYHEAVQAIRQGLQRDPDWPRKEFRPRIELYQGHEDAWTVQRQRLERSQLVRPQDGELLFLLGYLDWFDGHPREALDWFRQARPHLADPRPVDLFLKIAPAVVAAG